MDNKSKELIMLTTQDRIITKPPFTKEQIKEAFVTLPVARKRRNTKKHEGIVEGKKFC
jgi:hypothetical protein